MAEPTVLGFRRTRVVSLELTEPADPIAAEGYEAVLALARVRGVPVGCVTVPIREDVCDGEQLRRHAMETLATAISRELAVGALRSTPARMPSITVAVCTRDRAADLARCLAAVDGLDPPPDEVIVIDNGSRDPAVRDAVYAHPRARYVLEPVPGLDRARNRAIAESSCEIVAFTDDDVVVDRAWIGALRRAFADDAAVHAVTGLVMPLELETPAQVLFERYGGFGRGFRRVFHHADRHAGERTARLHGGAGKFGTGANMAFRRSVFGEIGTFDPALDVGTVTNGGGDLDMFFRVVEAGHVLRYEPSAVVWHRHRRTYAELRQQIANNGVGFYSYLVRNALAFPAERGDLVWLGAWWLWYWNIRRLLISLLKPEKFPRDLVVAELLGSFVGMTRYFRARRGVVARSTPPVRTAPRIIGPPPGASGALAVFVVDIRRVVEPITGISNIGEVAVSVICDGKVLGVVPLANRHRDISADLLIEGIVEQLGAARVLTALAVPARLAPPMPERGDPPPTKVSIVVATYDRPADLRRCLQSLIAQRSPYRLEIIVVDNHPASGLTAPVLAHFPGVRLVIEPRQGLSYARNAGIAASTGDIVVATDDDVAAPEDWIARLMKPFDDPAVMVVTGNVIPAELSTRSQRLFEAYGGLGRGPTRVQVGGHHWFWSFRGAVPTWTLGATANAAFRAAIFADPEIGLMDEALGAGMPTGCSEDTYVFYRVLRAGHAIVYEPDALVWHYHRADMRALRRQIYSYAKGHVAYQLLTLVRDGDRRALVRLLVQLPGVYVSRVRQRITRADDYPLRLIALELAGTLAGPLALWRSLRRVRRGGRSIPYTPPGRRFAQPDQHPAAEGRSEARSYAV